MTGDGRRWPEMTGNDREWQGMTGFRQAGGGDGIYARDLKRGALALRDFYL